MNFWIKKKEEELEKNYNYVQIKRDKNLRLSEKFIKFIFYFGNYLFFQSNLIKKIVNYTFIYNYLVYK